jgi:hypothetical protein
VLNPELVSFPKSVHLIALEAFLKWNEFKLPRTMNFSTFVDVGGMGI